MRLKVPSPLTWPPPRPAELPFELALKTGVAAGLSLWAAHALGLDFPIYALLAVATTAELGATSSRSGPMVHPDVEAPPGHIAGQE